MITKTERRVRFLLQQLTGYQLQLILHMIYTDMRLSNTVALQSGNAKNQMLNVTLHTLRHRHIRSHYTAAMKTAMIDAIAALSVHPGISKMFKALLIQYIGDVFDQRRTLRRPRQSMVKSL